MQFVEPMKGADKWKLAGLFGIAVVFAAYWAQPRLIHTKVSPAQVTSERAQQSYIKSRDLLAASVPVSAELSHHQLEAPVESQARSHGLSDRKIVRTGFLEAFVKSPAEAAEQVRRVAERLGGYVESAQISSSQSAPGATITIRVPAVRFEDAKAEIRKFAARVESEKTDATDVTKQYVDLQARVRSLRAEEVQYLTIMKSAGKVKDMLDVSEKLSNVRGEIEQQQAEFETLSKQVETVAITVSLRSEPVAPAAELHWRPVYQLTLAWHDALDGLADYANTMLAVIFYVPVVVLWILTFTLGVAGTWKLLRWGARVFFAHPKAAVN